MQIFEKILEFNLIDVYHNLKRLDITPEIYLVEWIMTIFSKTFNIDLAARIWDMYMIEGIKALYQAAIGILTIYKHTLSSGDYEMCLSLVKGNKNCLFDINQENLLYLMKHIKFSDSILFDIQLLNDEYIPI